MSQKIPAFKIFKHFATENMLIKPKESPLLHFSALCDIFWKKKNQKFQVFFQKKSFALFEP